MAEVTVAQNITSSPYSLFGIGDPLELNNTQGLSMGDVKYAMDRPFYLNHANPASYAGLDAVTFSLGAMLNRTRTFNETTSQDNDNGTLRYFGLGIPITKKIGISVGAKPFTAFGYGIQIASPDQSQGELYTRYEGQGGLNIVYAGMGYQLFADSIQKLTLGVNANYYFGNKEQIALNNLEDINGALNSAFLDSYVTGDFAFDLGLLYTLNLNTLFNTKGPVESKLTLGGTYAVANHLKTKFESFAGSYYYNSSRDFVITDTLRFSQDTSSIYLPTRYGVGLNYEIYNRESKNLLIIEADYEHYAWSDLLINGNNPNLENSDQFGLGLQFVPNAYTNRDFFKIIRYRVGLKYKSTRINLSSDPVKDYSASIGFGIPLVRSKSIYPTSSTFDFGVVVGNRGEAGNGLIREQYTNIYLGLSFSPNYWDRWFKKRKIN
ncbi:MAG: hypothetical protein ACPGVC_03160 [Salibacteraceae bacterium]